jgi:hypothetical protein
LTDAILAAVGHLVREGGPFVSALAGPGDARAAIARAFETIDGALDGRVAAGHSGSAWLEALLQARLIEGLKRGDVPAEIDIGELAVLYTGVAVGLVAETLDGAEPGKLEAIRQVALKLLAEPITKAP